MIGTLSLSGGKMITIGRRERMEWRNLLAELARKLRIDTYVELGTRDAGTFNLVAPYAKRAIAVDIKDTYEKYVNKLPHVEFILGNSREVYKDWAKREDSTIDLLFIDANHKYESVKADFDNWSPFIVEGTGIIAMHDTCPLMENYLNHCSTSHQFAWEVRTNDEYRKNYEIISLPGPYAGMSLVRKAKQQLINRNWCRHR